MTGPVVVLDPREQERGAVVKTAAASHPVVAQRPEVRECLRRLGAVHAIGRVGIVGKIQVPFPQISPQLPPELAATEASLPPEPAATEASVPPELAATEASLPPAPPLW